MPLLVSILAGLSVTLVMTGASQLVFGPARSVRREVARLQRTGPDPFGVRARRGRRERRLRLRKAFRDLGERIEDRQVEMEGVRLRLIQAGYWDSDAVRYYLAARVVLPAGLVGTTPSGRRHPGGADRLSGLDRPSVVHHAAEIPAVA